MPIEDPKEDITILQEESKDWTKKNKWYSGSFLLHKNSALGARSRFLTIAELTSLPENI